ncbi:bark storage protein A-like [Pyrus ussuriensis x Pyrus communis]|uniref:Bark storage protein A-like n=1 Tax=Pyrus ussuriensis x Pyrus communis TaxID=2448454 RepID=A0A5N5G7A7_9ROSA|nr:bark storage protein A-like [Pyrus ussuriensis x Pyrus communis]KAB2609611.1 bark storage protein A-like [Pyrus ussuriensis x Pyrus communis]
MTAKQVSQCFIMLVLFSLLAVSSFSLPLNRKSLNLIEEVNRKGPYFGLITVVTLVKLLNERKVSYYHTALGILAHIEFVILMKFETLLNEVNAAAATKQMVDLFDIVGIVHFGIARNADNSMSIGDNPSGTVNYNDVAGLDFKGYNVPEGGDNLLGHIGFSYEFFSESGKANTARPIFGANTTRQWLHVASNLKGINLNQCVNSSVCLPQKPKLVVGLRGSASNIFVDNAAYRDFLFKTFRVSSVNMVRLLDIAGGQTGHNSVDTFGPLAAINACKVVIKFIEEFPKEIKS